METVRFRLRQAHRGQPPPEDEFLMPGICSTCGEPSERLSLRVYGSSWFSNRLLVMRFPLCAACDEAYYLLSRRRRLGCGIAGALALLLGMAWAVAGMAGSVYGWLPGGTLSLWFLGAAAVVLLGGLALYALLPYCGAPAQVRQRYRQVKRSVDIPSFNPGGVLGEGSIVIRFACPPFAEAFKKLNRGAILGSKK